jgi:hypothetical protein
MLPVPEKKAKKATGSGGASGKQTVKGPSGKVFRRLAVGDAKAKFQAVVEAAGLEYVKSHGYYQVGKKKENISATKQIVLMNEETGEIIDDSTKGRQTLKLGKGKVSLKADAGEVGGATWQIYVQSTSANRGLLPGSHALFQCPPGDDDAMEDDEEEGEEEEEEEEGEGDNKDWFDYATEFDKFGHTDESCEIGRKWKKGQDLFLALCDSKIALEEGGDRVR